MSDFEGAVLGLLGALVEVIAGIIFLYVLIG